MFVIKVRYQGEEWFHHYKGARVNSTETALQYHHETEAEEDAALLRTQWHGAEITVQRHPDSPEEVEEKHRIFAEPTLMRGGMAMMHIFSTDPKRPTFRSAMPDMETAKLFSAAPDLLAACEAARLAFRAVSRQVKDYSAELDLLNSAIRKAKMGR